MEGRRWPRGAWMILEPSGRGRAGPLPTTLAARETPQRHPEGPATGPQGDVGTLEPSVTPIVLSASAAVRSKQLRCSRATFNTSRSPAVLLGAHRAVRHRPAADPAWGDPVRLHATRHQLGGGISIAARVPHWQLL